MSGWSKRPDWILRLARAALFLPTLLLFAARGRAQEPSAPDITLAPIRVQVNLVSVSVVVTDETGHFVDSLQKENFLVLDNGVEQPLTHFAAVAEPAQVLLLVESGPAVYLLESGHLQSAYALLNGLSRDDRVAVIGYAERPLPILDFTTDKTAAAGALGGIALQSRLRRTESLRELACGARLARLHSREENRRAALNRGGHLAAEHRRELTGAAQDRRCARSCHRAWRRVTRDEAEEQTESFAGENRRCGGGVRPSRRLAESHRAGQRRARLFSEERQGIQGGVCRNRATRAA